MKRLLTIFAMLWITANLMADKAPVFIYAGQSNADGREYVQNLPEYMKVGESPYSPYTHLKWASICGNPTASTFGTRSMKTGERYAFCDVTNYWIDQTATQDFYAIKCAYGGTAIAPNVTAEKLPVWYADATWMETHHAYAGQDITQEANRNNNSLTKNLTEGFASLVDNVLAAIEGGYDVKAIMWHQGESDRNAASSYYQNFKTMIAYMRQAIYAKTGDEQDLQLPFIFGTVCRNSIQYSTGVETAQRQVADEDANVYLIDMSNATLREDNLHFDKQATDYLGKKMYNKLVELGLAVGPQVEVEEFPAPVSPMDGATHYDNHTWNIVPISDDTQTKLASHVSAGTLYNTHATYGTRRSSNIYEEQLLYSDGTAVVETEGIYFIAGSNRVAINTTYGLWFVNGEPTFILPKLKAGQIVKITARAHSNNGTKLMAADGSEDYLELMSDNTLTTTSVEVTFRVRYNFTGEKHLAFRFSGGAHTQVSKIEVSTPESVDVLIGADRIETFASSQPLDFSPFTDLFKAYVVTGYDDATGVVDMEQVLQVPANTGVVLMGEECEVKVPVIEGDAPVLAQTNLLTAVVGSGTAPADSYVLTTSAGVTQFTKTASAKSLSNQAYLATLGSLNSYGFNPMEAKTEHVYDIEGGGILAKGTLLTFTDTKHHTLNDGGKSVDVYGPANATGLDGRFVFDNSGNWAMHDSYFRLGANSGKTLYCSVVSLVHGDRVKIEVTGNTPSNVTMTVLNSALRGVSANETITAGTIYVVEADAGKTVNLDLKMYCGTNRAGFTKITVWSSTETTPIYTVSTPTATLALQQVREGLYKPVATLTTKTDADVTYYYKGGDAADWTALDGNAFEPSQKAEYQFKAVAPGFADSDILTLALGYRYTLGRTVVDLTSESVYTAATKDNSGFDWTTDENMNKIFSASMPDGQVYGHLKNATAITGITLQDSKLDARYSFAKGVGLACNYGYWVKTADATAYDFAEYESYNTTTLAETNKTIVYNPNAVEFKFATLKTVRLYEPVEVATVTVSNIGYATYCSTEALDFTDSGVEAYYATADGDDVNFNNYITNPAASTGLLLKAPAGTYEVLVAESGTDVSEANLLKATFEEKTVGTTEGCDYGKVFILAKHDGKLGFYRSNSGRTLQAGKSYLYLEVSEARAAIGFPFDSETSALLSVAASQSQPSHIYDLQGRSISAEANSSLFTPHTSLKKGIYIVNGKKIIIK